MTIRITTTFVDFITLLQIMRAKKSVNKLKREHFTSLNELGQLKELTLKKFTTIIEHDKVKV